MVLRSVVRRLSGFMLAMIFACGAASSASQKPPLADGAYAAFAERYFAWQFAIDPVNATFTGVHTYDAKLTNLSAGAFAKRNLKEHAFLEELLGIERQSLSARTRVDAKALELQMRDDLLQNETMKLWRKQPSMYVGFASFGVQVLISRRFAPAEQRLRDVIARESAIPNLFRTARRNLANIDGTGAEIGRGEALGLAAFLTSDVPQAFTGVRDPALRRELARSTQRARASALAFAAWLKPFIAHPTGSYRVGAENYRAMLRYEDDVDMPLPQYLAVGERALRATHAQIIAVARRIDPGKSVGDVIKEVSRRHPPAARLVAVARDDLKQLRRFIIERHIIVLPPESDITVQETPPFERETVLAQMDAPGPLERVSTKAYYYVTPPDPHDPPRVQEAYLEQFNDFERPLTGAHEAYPGHFVNFTIDRHLPLSLTEQLVGASVFAEGWAHYCEQMMVDEGWGNGDPRVRLFQLKWALVREARYVVGLKLHTGSMTVPQAEQFFERYAFLDPADARIEAKRGTEDPLYGYYTLGKLEILKLRSDYKKKMGARFTLAGFHQALLQYGDFPVPLIRPLILGASDDGKVL